MTHLYELSEQYKILTDILESGECNQDNVEQILKQVTDELNNKAGNIGKLILSLSSDNESLGGEIQRLSMRKTATSNKIDWLKSYLLQELTCANIEKIKTALISINVRTNPTSVKVLNPNEVPVEYRRIIPETWEVDKVKILELVKSTGEIPNGVEVIRDKKRIEVK